MNNANANEMQRFLELQRQYLHDLQHQSQTPGSNNSRQNNWKS